LARQAARAGAKAAHRGVARNADDPILLAKQVERFGGLFGDLDNPLQTADAIVRHALLT
jgi:hypothetical protein